MKTQLRVLAAIIGAALSAPAVADNICDPTIPPSGSLDGVACGKGNSNIGVDSSALGINNLVLGSLEATAVGFGNFIGDDANFSSAIGHENQATAEGSNAFGAGNFATAAASNAYGAGNTAAGVSSNAFGGGNTATGTSSNAFGIQNTVSGSGSSAVGTLNLVFGGLSNALGRGNLSSGSGSLSAGTGNTAVGSGATALGGWLDGGNGIIDFEALFDNAGNLVLDEQGNVVQFTQEAALALGDGATAIGPGSRARDDGAIAIGRDATAFDTGTVAVGREAFVASLGGTAIGDGATVESTATNSVAIGAGSTTTRANAFSVGAFGAERQLVNVAAAAADTDAVNLGQLRTAVAAFGAGADFGNGVFAPPSYVVQGANFADVGAAFDAVDSKLTELDGRVGGPAGPQGPAGPIGPTGPQGPQGPAGGDPLSVVYDNGARDTLTLQGAQGTRVANVADGAAPTDAANVRQVQNGNAQTLSQANAYTESRIQALNLDLPGFRREIDDRFANQDKRISRVGAMGTAMAQMTASAAGIRAPNRLAVGTGVQGGHAAFAVGYQRAIGDNATFTVGGAISGDGEDSVGAGYGVGW